MSGIASFRDMQHDLVTPTHEDPMGQRPATPRDLHDWVERRLSFERRTAEATRNGDVDKFNAQVCRVEELTKRVEELERLVRDLRALVDSQGDTIRALSRLTLPAPVYPSPGLLPPAVPGAPWQPPIITCGQSQEPTTICGTGVAQGHVGAFRAVDPVEWTRTALVQPGQLGALVEQGREQA